jgi:hypothetical protein
MATQLRQQAGGAIVTITPPLTTTLYTVPSGQQLYLDYFFMVPGAALTSAQIITVLADSVVFAKMDIVTVAGIITLSFNRPLIIQTSLQITTTGAGVPQVQYYFMGDVI